MPVHLPKISRIRTNQLIDDTEGSSGVPDAHRTPALVRMQTYIPVLYSHSSHT